MRTPEQVVAFYEANRALDATDRLGWFKTELICRLPLEYAKPYLRADRLAAAERGGWIEDPRTCSHEHLLEVMRLEWPNAAREIRERCLPCVVAYGLRYAAWTWLFGDEVTSNALLSPLRAALDKQVALAPQASLAVIDVKGIADGLQALANKYDLRIAEQPHVH